MPALRVQIPQVFQRVDCILLQEISDYYAGVLRNALKTLTSMIEPLLIVVMGSVVGFIAMAIILPIFKMSSIVSG